MKTTSHEVIEISDSEDEQPARLKEEELSTTFIAWTKGRKKEKDRGIEMGGNEQISSLFPFGPSMFTKDISKTGKSVHCNTLPCMDLNVHHDHLLGGALFRAR